MKELIKYFNDNYGSKYGNIDYPRTKKQIYSTYQIIKEFGLKDYKLNNLLNNIELPIPKTIGEKDLYSECISKGKAEGRNIIWKASEEDLVDINKEGNIIEIYKTNNLKLSDIYVVVNKKEFPLFKVERLSAPIPPVEGYEYIYNNEIYLGLLDIELIDDSEGILFDEFGIVAGEKKIALLTMKNEKAEIITSLEIYTKSKEVISQETKNIVLGATKWIELPLEKPEDLYAQSIPNKNTEVKALNQDLPELEYVKTNFTKILLDKDYVLNILENGCIMHFVYNDGFLVSDAFIKNIHFEKFYIFENNIYIKKDFCIDVFKIWLEPQLALKGLVLDALSPE